MAYSSTSCIQDFKYDAFLSFSTRKNFVDHLYYALEDRGIITYKDDVTLKIGNEISSALLQAIKESKIYIIIFSKTYASSGWCLNELVKIMECDKTIEHTTYPVFYDVAPTDIRHQPRDFGEAFAKHEEDANVGKWREALTEAANLSGHFLKNVDDGHEGRFVKRIAEHILKLHPIKMYIDKPIVGMERRMEAVLSSIERGIDEVRMIGISGIGGGGKTTLAKAVFNKISTRFEGISFVENIREVAKMSGLQSLQKQVILDVSKGKDMVIHSVGHGKNLIMNILRGKKVLIVLDDVDHNDQLVALIYEPNWYKVGSRIIITARNKQVLLPYVVMPIHEVDLLSNEEAKGLFNSFAFTGGIPTQGYQELSEEAVHSAGGLPLYIQSLGRFLCGKDMLEWREQLERLKSIPLEDSNKRLELSYVDLEKDFQDIFLDVACFLKGSHKEEAIRILKICGLPGRIGLRDLELKSLITFSSDQHLDMHDIYKAWAVFWGVIYGDAGEAIAYVSSCYPDANLYAAVWSLGLHLHLYMSLQEGDRCLLSGRVSLCNSFDVVLAVEELHKDLNKVYDRILGASISKLFSRRVLLFEGIEGDYNISIAINSKSYRDFDESYMRVAFGLKSADDFYKKLSSSDAIKNAANDPMAPIRGIPHEAVEVLTDTYVFSRCKTSLMFDINILYNKKEACLTYEMN